MAVFKAVGPDGKPYSVEAPDAQSAGQALDEMMQAGGGQSQPDPAAARDSFSAGFDPSQDSAPTAEGIDQRLNGEADNRGRWATAGNALTMGMGDEVMGLLGGAITFAQGKGFDEGYGKMTSSIRGDIGQYAERHPVEHAAIDIAGSIPTAMIPGGAAVRGASLGGKIARGVVAGAGYGAVQGYAEGEGGVNNRLESAGIGAAVGGGIGGAVPAIGAGIGKAVGGRVGRAAIPSTGGLDDAATALYQRAGQAGVAIQPKALVRVNTALPQRLQAAGFDPQLHPKTATAINRIYQMTQTGAPLSLEEVENTRRVIRQAISASSGPDGKADRQMAYRVLDQFDTWMNGLQPKDMLASGQVSGRDAIRIVQEARGLWSRKSKGETLADIVEAAQLDDDVERGIRNGFKRLAKNKERFAPFTAGEKAAIKKVARGGDMGWITRSLGSFSPTTLGGAIRSGLVGGLGALTGNPVAVALPAAGYVAKKVGDATTRSAVKNASAMVRAGGAVPIDTKAAKTAGDYATRLIGAAAQAGAPQLLPSRP